MPKSNRPWSPDLQEGLSAGLYKEFSLGRGVVLGEGSMVSYSEWSSDFRQLEPLGSLGHICAVCKASSGI